MSDKNDKDHSKLETTTAMSGEIVDMQRVDILKMPMKGKVQYPYNQPFDRHKLSRVAHDQTDRAAIARYTRDGIEAIIQKKLSGREYTWSIVSDRNAQQRYGDIYIDRENRGDEYALSIFIPQIDAAIDHLIS